MAVMVVEAKSEKLVEVLSVLEQELEDAGCGIREQMQLEIALEEIFVNIASYAYPDGAGEVTVRIHTDQAANMAEITLIDSGIPYNPLKKEDPDITQSAEERPIGGLGIYMVKASMDSVEYAYRDGQNVFTMRKAWEGKAG